MKRTGTKHNYSTQRIYRYAYPNAAHPSYYIHRLREGALALVSVMGSVTIFLLLMTL